MAILVTAHLGVDGLGIYATGWAIYALISTAGEGGRDELPRSGDQPRRVAHCERHQPQSSRSPRRSSQRASRALAEIVVAHIGYTAEIGAAVVVILLVIVPKVLNMIQEGVFVAHGKVGDLTFTRLSRPARTS